MGVQEEGMEWRKNLSLEVQEKAVGSQSLTAHLLSEFGNYFLDHISSNLHHINFGNTHALNILFQIHERGVFQFY